MGPRAKRPIRARRGAERHSPHPQCDGTRSRAVQGTSHTRGEIDVVNGEGDSAVRPPGRVAQSSGRRPFIAALRLRLSGEESRAPIPSDELPREAEHSPERPASGPHLLLSVPGDELPRPPQHAAHGAPRPGARVTRAPDSARAPLGGRKGRHGEASYSLSRVAQPSEKATKPPRNSSLCGGQPGCADLRTPKCSNLRRCPATLRSHPARSRRNGLHRGDIGGRGSCGRWGYWHGPFHRAPLGGRSPFREGGAPLRSGVRSGMGAVLDVSSGATHATSTTRSGIEPMCELPSSTGSVRLQVIRGE